METVATFLTTIGTIITAAFTWMQDVVDFILKNPVLFVPLMVFFLVGGAIGLVMRIVRG